MILKSPAPVGLRTVHYTVIIIVVRASVSAEDSASPLVVVGCMAGGQLRRGTGEGAFMHLCINARGTNLIHRFVERCSLSLDVSDFAYIILCCLV